MFNRTTSTKFFAPRRHRMKIRNPKHEILIKPKHSNLKFEIRNEIVWNFMVFDHLDMFRISDFEFRTFNSIYTWRALRLCGSPRGISFPQKRYLFIHGIISRGEPRGVLALVETIQLGRAVTQRGEASFSQFRNPKFNRKFQNIFG